jgi:hypothetical protein
LETLDGVVEWKRVNDGLPFFPENADLLLGAKEAPAMLTDTVLGVADGHTGLDVEMVAGHG